MRRKASYGFLIPSTVFASSGPGSSAAVLCLCLR
jgi:hypothetical protein